MLNLTLYKREMKGSIRIILIFAAVLSLYIYTIISMYNAEMMLMLNEFAELMPEVMAAFGMSAGATDGMIGFLISYLFGFLFLVVPMVFSILRGNALVARYVERGAMSLLLASPVKRRTVAFTQMAVLVTGILILTVFSAVTQIVLCEMSYPGELQVGKLMLLSLGLFCIQLFIGGICYLASCMFSETKYSVGFGAGIPSLMFVLQMLVNTGVDANSIKYFTFFTLFDPNGIVANEFNALMGVALLFVGAVALYAAGIVVFCKRDLHV